MEREGEGSLAKVDCKKCSKDSVEGLVSHETEVHRSTNQARLGSLREEKVRVRGEKVSAEQGEA